MIDKIEKDAKLLMINDILYSFTAVFLETFLVAYFLKTTNESIFVVSTYYIILYTLMGFGSVLLGRYMKKKPHISKLFLCIGVFIKAFFILGIVLAGNRISDYYILIAIIYSISHIFYWCAHEIIYLDVTNENNRKRFMSLDKIFNKLVNIIVPVVLGASIEFYSFSKITVYVFAVSILEAVSVIFIRNSKLVSADKKYSIVEYFKHLKKDKCFKEKYYYLSVASYAIIESVISTLIVIITIMTFKTSINLGILTTVFSFFSMFTLLMYKNFYNRKNSKYILTACALVFLLSVIGLLLDISKTTLVIYNFCYANILCIFEVTYYSRKGDLVEECKIENYKEEHIGMNSLALALGRFIGYSLMIAVSFVNSIVYFKLLLFVITLNAPLFSFLMNKTYKDKTRLKHTKNA